MSREDYNFANLSEEDLNTLKSAESKLAQHNGKEVILLAYTK
ncbi:hypothetical protein RDV78_02495 [Bacillota bacterium LX-D]|nr:hypothetical protein [Bacillota bacterium LX-D]